MIISLLAAMLLQGADVPGRAELEVTETAWVHCMLGQNGWLQRVEGSTPAELASRAPQQCLDQEQSYRALLTASLLPSRGQEVASTEAERRISTTRAEAEAILIRLLTMAQSHRDQPPAAVNE